MQWRKLNGQEPGTRGMPMMERIQMPLLFEPGTSWMYGASTDWAGVLTARLNKITLEEYMQKNIWDPLGIKNITFHNELKPDVKKNKVKLTYRGGIDNPQLGLPADTGKPVVWTDDLVYDDPIPIGDEFGGQGGIGSAFEYSKILTSILINDSKLLKPATVDLMFTPQLSDAPRAALGEFLGAELWKDTFASQPAGAKLDWGLAGCLTFDDKPTGRRAGTLTWSGLTNLLWTVDRDAGLATFYASNILPFGDHASHKYQQMFEKEVYSRFGKTAKL
jgi:CubicO group peptidase (beta-lactamase class C family)